MPTSLKPASSLPTTLLLVDIQAGLTTTSGFYGTSRSTPSLESNLTALLAATRSYNSQHPDSPAAQVSIIHVNHNSSNPDSPLYPGKDTNKPMPCAAPADAEILLHKNIHSAFGNPQLEYLLKDKDIKQLLICGITTAHCVSTTTRVASDLNVVGDDGVIALIDDCSAAFNTEKFDAETVHAVNVASLEGEFAGVVRTKDVLEAVLR